MLLNQRLRIGEILQAFRAPTGRIAPGPELLVQQVVDAEHAQPELADTHLDGASDRVPQSRIVRELHRRALGSDPVLAVGVAPRLPEARALEPGARDVVVIGHRY